MTTNGLFERYQARRWRTVPVHTPDPATAACSCGRVDCAKPGKHPIGQFWPGGSADPAHFAGRNLGVKLGPDSQNLADTDLDCGEAVTVGPLLLPTTDSAFGRAGQVTHALYTVPGRDAVYLKLLDPALTGDRATIIELRWPEWDADEERFKALQTVFPPSLHESGDTVEWVRDGTPAEVPGADLVAAVRHVGATVLLARYAKPKERHSLVLLLANLLVRAGCATGFRRSPRPSSRSWRRGSAITRRAWRRWRARRSCWRWAGAGGPGAGTSGTTSQRGRGPTARAESPRMRANSGRGTAIVCYRRPGPLTSD